MIGGHSTRFSRIVLLVALTILGALWFVYFDSFSLMKRRQWNQEFMELQEENERLRAEIAVLEARLEAPPTDEEIEKIAREQYGMRRKGETVYRVE